MDDRFNTIAGWTLFAGIVALGASIVAGESFHSERPEHMGYPIEGVVEEGAGKAEAEKPIEFYLASADPAAGATVKTAPTEVSITFTDEVEPKFSSIEVLEAGGKRVDDGKAHTAPDNEKLLSIGLKPLTPGTYKVIWHATAADDSHKTKGSYEFTVKP